VHRFGVLAAAVLAAAAPPATKRSAAQETAQFRNGAEIVTLAVHLDSLGVVAAPMAPDDSVEAYLTAAGMTGMRSLAPGVYAVALPSPAAGYPALYEVGRALYQAAPGIIAVAGPLVRFTPSGVPAVVPDQFIVKYHPQAMAIQVDSLVADFFVQELDRSTDPDIRLYRATQESPQDLFAVISAFEASPTTEYAFPEYLEEVAPSRPVARSTPVAPTVGVPRSPAAERVGTTAALDPLVSDQWHLDNASGADIDAVQAWSVTTGSQDVVIAVIEPGGFDVTHPDLKDRLWQNTSEVGGTAGSDDDGNLYVDDEHGFNFRPCSSATGICGDANLETTWTQTHGTAVAGLAGAQGDNGAGVSGVCPDCRLMLLPTGGQWGKLRAFKYAYENGADVISASFPMLRNTALEAIVTDVANGTGGTPGIPIVWAIGNGPTDQCQTSDPSVRYFNSMPEVFSVGGSNDQDVRVSTSNTGDCLDIIAPGGFGASDLGITTTDDQISEGYNPGFPCPRGELTTTQDYTNCFGGTSAATPIVAGVVGLMTSVYPDISRADVYDILRKTADKVDCANAMYDGAAACPADPMARSDTYGYGRVDAYKAVVDTKGLFATKVNAVPQAPMPMPRFEVGARAGWTSVSGGTAVPDETVTNLAGGGPRAEPVIHLTWYSGSMTPARWMWEVQLGTRHSSQASPPLEVASDVAAFQVAYLFNAAAPSLYLGAGVAASHTSSGTLSATTTNRYAAGAALGIRVPLSPHLAIRTEGRVRSWNNGGGTEVGIAVIIGAVVP
jgi:hypothetical protein